MYSIINQPLLKSGLCNAVHNPFKSFKITLDFTLNPAPGGVYSMLTP